MEAALAHVLLCNIGEAGARSAPPLQPWSQTLLGHARALQELHHPYPPTPHPPTPTHSPVTFLPPSGTSLFLYARMASQQSTAHIPSFSRTWSAPAQHAQQAAQALSGGQRQWGGQ